MQTPMRHLLIRDASTRAAVATVVLVFGLLTTSAGAQTTAPAGTSPSNAQLQEENRALRQQVEQLQLNQKTPATPGQAPAADAPAKPGCCKGKGMKKQGKPMGKSMPGMGMDKGMPNNGTAGMPTDAPMKKGGMEPMEKHGPMGMPPGSDQPKDPPADTGHE